MPLRGTIESVYKGTLVYAREHNPTVVVLYDYNDPCGLQHHPMEQDHTFICGN